MRWNDMPRPDLENQIFWLLTKGILHYLQRVGYDLATEQQILHYKSHIWKSARKTI